MLLFAYKPRKIFRYNIASVKFYQFMIKNIKVNIIYIDLFIFIFSFFLILFTLNFPFYWDNTVQISFPANWYFETNFKHFYLPDNIATGHPTFAGMYFAFIWKIFERSLMVSHWGMLPFVFGLLFQIYRLLINIEITRTRTKLIIFVFTKSLAPNLK